MSSKLIKIGAATLGALAVLGVATAARADEPCVHPQAYPQTTYQQPYVQQPYVQPTYVQPTYVQPTYVAPRYVAPRYVAPAYVEPAYYGPRVVVRPAPGFMIQARLPWHHRQHRGWGHHGRW